MRIAISCQNLTVSKAAGPDVYLLNLLRALAKIDIGNHYTLICYRNTDLELKDIGTNLANFTLVKLPKILSFTHVTLQLYLLIKSFDIYFTSYHTLPFIKNPKTKYVSMIHGLEYLTNSLTKRKFSVFKGWSEKVTLVLSDKVIVPSNYVRTRIEEMFNSFVDIAKVTVINEGVSPHFYERTEIEIASVKKKYEITGEYLLFVSTIQPRKNLPRTIEVLSLLLTDPRYKGLQFVICGKNGWEYEESLKAPEKFNIERNVKFVGYTDIADIPALFSGCSAYISFSLDEGFGLPILEAFSCRTLACISDIPAYRETGDKFAFFAQPTDTQSILATLKKALNLAKPQRERLCDDQAAFAKTQTWDKTAVNTLKLFQSLGQNS